MFPIIKALEQFQQLWTWTISIKQHKIANKKQSKDNAPKKKLKEVFKSCNKSKDQEHDKKTNKR